MRRIAVVLAWLLPALVSGGCNSLKGGAEAFNAPGTYVGPGCYDHKGRIERTIHTKFDCDFHDWVWKP